MIVPCNNSCEICLNLIKVKNKIDILCSVPENSRAEDWETTYVEILDDYNKLLKIHYSYDKKI